MSLAVPRIKSYNPRPSGSQPAAALARPLVIAITISHNLSVSLQISVRFLPINWREPTSADVTAGLMSKGKGRRGPKIPASQTRQLVPVQPAAPPALAPPALGYDPTGPMEQRNVVAAKDGWSEYKLDDGSTIRAKTVILDVKRAVGQFNAVNGDPTYVLQMASITSVDAPDHLKKRK